MLTTESTKGDADKVELKSMETTPNRDDLFCLKVAKTVLYTVAWICLGMMASISNPTIPDLRERLGVSMEDISLALAFRSLGVPVGSIAGGMISDRYRDKSDLVGAISMAVGGLSTIAIPLMPGLPGVGVASFTCGLGHGGIDAVGHAAIQWMWAEKSGIPMHVLHLGSPIGATIAPLIAQPFLSSENDTSISTTDAPLTTDVVVKNVRSTFDREFRPEPIFHSNREENIESRIEIPFGITGGFAVTLALILLVFFLVGCTRHLYKRLYGRSKQSMKEVFSPQSFSSLGDTKYTVILMVLICVFFAFVSSKDITMDTFIFSYAVDSELQFSKDEAAALSAAYNAAGIFGRVICIATARWCPVEPILIFSTIFTATFSACIAFLGTEKDIYIWTFALLFKLTASPVWPCTILWASKYIKFSSLVVGFIQISSSLATFASQWASGYLYDTYGPEAHVYYGMCCGFMMVIILTALQLIGSCCKREMTPDIVKDVVERTRKEHGSTVTLELEFTSRL